MKNCKKIITLLLMVLLIAAVTPAAFAAGTSVEAGKTATLTFSFVDVFNVDGSFAIDDPQGIVSGYTINVTSSGATTATVSGDFLWATPGAEPVKTTVSVAVKVTIKSNAPVGAKCTVSFTGIYGDGNGEPGNEQDVYQSAAVSVKETASTPSSQPSTPTQTPQVDYSALRSQIAKANGLSSSEYTAASWNTLLRALSDGNSALSSTSQSKVDSAADALEHAITALVKMDYSGLNAALAEVEDFMCSEGLIDRWEQLSALAAEGESLLTSGDQDAVDAAADEIVQLLTQIRESLEELRQSNVVEIPVEVPVEVLPEGEYCNIASHRIWPVVFFISLALNVILSAVIVAYVAKKQRNRKDDTPLVDYDIGDDE